MPAKMPMGPGAEWRLVVISESSGWGLGSAFAQRIESDLGVKVIVDDFAIGDLCAGDVLLVLQTGKADSSLRELPTALKKADVVVMFASPMSSVDSGTAQSIARCFGSLTPAPCTAKGFEQFAADLKAIWGKVVELRTGQPTILRAMDVASPFVSAWKRNQVFDVCTVCWEGVSAAVRQAAEAFHIPVLSRYDAFNGVKHDRDPAHQGYVGPDGIHLSELAVQYTAELLARLGYEPTIPPQV